MYGQAAGNSFSASHMHGHFRLARKHHAHIGMVENFTEQLNLAELSIVNQFVRFINNQ